VEEDKVGALVGLYGIANTSFINEEEKKVALAGDVV
jgi:hypothetical protein